MTLRLTTLESLVEYPEVATTAWVPVAALDPEPCLTALGDDVVPTTVCCHTIGLREAPAVLRRRDHVRERKLAGGAAEAEQWATRFWCSDLVGRRGRFGPVACGFGGATRASYGEQCEKPQAHGGMEAR